MADWFKHLWAIGLPWWLDKESQFALKKCCTRMKAILIHQDEVLWNRPSLRSSMIAQVFQQPIRVLRFVDFTQISTNDSIVSLQFRCLQIDQVNPWQRDSPYRLQLPSQVTELHIPLFFVDLAEEICETNPSIRSMKVISEIPSINRQQEPDTRTHTFSNLTTVEYSIEHIFNVDDKVLNFVMPQIETLVFSSPATEKWKFGEETLQMFLMEPIAALAANAYRFPKMKTVVINLDVVAPLALVFSAEGIPKFRCVVNKNVSLRNLRSWKLFHSFFLLDCIQFTMIDGLTFQGVHTENSKLYKVFSCDDDMMQQSSQTIQAIQSPYATKNEVKFEAREKRTLSPPPAPTKIVQRRRKIVASNGAVPKQLEAKKRLVFKDEDEVKDRDKEKKRLKRELKEANLSSVLFQIRFFLFLEVESLLCLCGVSQRFLEFGFRVWTSCKYNPSSFIPITSKQMLFRLSKQDILPKICLFAPPLTQKKLDEMHRYCVRGYNTVEIQMRDDAFEVPILQFMPETSGLLFQNPSNRDISIMDLLDVNPSIRILETRGNVLLWRGSQIKFWKHVFPACIKSFSMDRFSIFKFPQLEILDVDFGFIDPDSHKSDRNAMRGIFNFLAFHRSEKLRVVTFFNWRTSWCAHWKKKPRGKWQECATFNLQLYDVIEEEHYPLSEVQSFLADLFDTDVLCYTS